MVWWSSAGYLRNLWPFQFLASLGTTEVGLLSELGSVAAIGRENQAQPKNNNSRQASRVDPCRDASCTAVVGCHGQLNFSFPPVIAIAWAHSALALPDWRCSAGADGVELGCCMVGAVAGG